MKNAGLMTVWIALVMMCAGCVNARPPSEMTPSQSVTPGLAEYTCHRVIDKIVLDGKLDEESWKKAASTGNFMMYSGDQESPVRTTAKLVWDNDSLYVAFECEDTDIYATFTKRDEALYTQDVVELFAMNQASEEGHFLEYEISPRGTLFDLYLTAPFKGTDWASEGFDAGATFNGTLNKASDKDSGYTVEIAVPFADIYQRKGACPKEGDAIRLNLYRIDYATPQKIGDPGAGARLITWSPTIKPSFHMPDRFGVVTFVSRPVGE